MFSHNFILSFQCSIVGSLTSKNSVQSNGTVTVTTVPVTNSISNSINNTSTISNNVNRNQSSSTKENVVAPQNAPSVKKSRPKTSSPTRHGPQQCPVNIVTFAVFCTTWHFLLCDSFSLLDFNGHIYIYLVLFSLLFVCLFVACVISLFGWIYGACASFWNMDFTFNQYHHSISCCLYQWMNVGLIIIQ